MKLSFYFCILATVVAPLAASAQSKRMGPSAIEAARLKRYPPPNYLSHYLPDDRYKIAGGVWKYVSTDLDTYYHLPSSANMLRQPANRVIGFANAHDAEEAGYEPDPTDGTAARVAEGATLKTRRGFTLPGGSRRKLTKEEDTYLARLEPLLDRVFDNLNATVTQLEKMQNAKANGESQAMTILNQYRSFGTRNLASSQRLVIDLSNLKPPARFRRAHTYYQTALLQNLRSASYLNQGFQKSDPSYYDRFKSAFDSAMSYIDKGTSALKAATGT